MIRMAILDDVPGTVLNVVDYEDDAAPASGSAPPGFELLTCIEIAADSLVSIGWLYDGTTFTNPAPPLPQPALPMPTSTSTLGMQRALTELGLWDEAVSRIAADPAVQNAWTLAMAVLREDIEALPIGLTPVQIDALMVRACELAPAAMVNEPADPVKRARMRIIP